MTRSRLDKEERLYWYVRIFDSCTRMSFLRFLGMVDVVLEIVFYTCDRDLKP